MKRATLILLLVVNIACSQNQNKIWYFGGEAGLDFNSGSPVALTNSAMYQAEGCATISDTLGNLLFYTDGVTIWNANHFQMQNGSGLLGDNSSTQSALIVPKPLNCDKYFIFTVPSQDTLTPLSYSVVDMSFNSGLGKVTSKNNALHHPVTERINATLKSNGIDYWMVTQDGDSSSFLVYSISSTGINTSPMMFPTCNPLPPGPGNSSFLGELKLSKDGSKVGYASQFQNFCVVCDFDNSIGHISNCYSLTQSGSPYGLEFSPDASKLYVSSLQAPFVLWQYDLSAGSSTAIQNSEQLIDSTFGPPYQYGGALQLAPDNKIYVGRLQKGFLGVINQPNLSGAFCNYVDSAVSLNGKICQDGLPNFIKQYSPCSLGTGINTEFSTSVFVISPNPFHDITAIEFSNTEREQFTFHLYDINGQLVEEKLNIFTGKVIVEEEDLSSGMYFFQLESNKRLIRGKLLKE